MRKTRRETKRLRAKEVQAIQKQVQKWQEEPPRELTLRDVHAQVVWQLYDQAERTVAYLEKLARAHTKGAEWYGRRLASAVRVARGMVHADPILPRGARVGRWER